MDPRRPFRERLATSLALGATASWAALQLAVARGWELSGAFWAGVGFFSLALVAACSLGLAAVLCWDAVQWWRHRKTLADITAEVSPRSARIVVRNRGPVGTFTALGTVSSVEGADAREVDFPRTYHLAWDPLQTPDCTLASGGSGVIQLLQTQPASAGGHVLLRNLCLLAFGGGELRRVVDIWPPVTAGQKASVVVDIEVVRAGTAHPASTTFRVGVDERGLSLVQG